MCGAAAWSGQVVGEGVSQVTGPQSVHARTCTPLHHSAPRDARASFGTRAAALARHPLAPPKVRAHAQVHHELHACEDAGDG